MPRERETIMANTAEALGSLPTSEYTVEWSINLDAETPVDAARQALGIQRDPGGIATVFRVWDQHGYSWRIDLEDPDDPIHLRR